LARRRSVDVTEEQKFDVLETLIAITLLRL